MTDSEQSLYLRRLRFPAELEHTFQTNYYANIRSTLRVMLGPLIAFVLFFTVRDALFSHTLTHDLTIDGIVLALCLLLFGLTYWNTFARFWQPATVGIIWVAMTLMLNGPAVTEAARMPSPSSRAPRQARSFPPPSNAGDPSAPSSPAESRGDFPPSQEGRSRGTPDRFGAGPEASAMPEGSPEVSGTSPSMRGNRSTRQGDGPRAALNDQVVATQLYTILICLAALRLQFFWALLLNSSLLCSALTVLVTRLHLSSRLVIMFAERSLLVLFALMLSAIVQERLARSAFLANYQLDQERSNEKRKREQTEGKLQVLGQAIGGIVHDLGSPLGAVQGGAQLLEQMISEGENNPETLQELTGIINEGAELLNYQRLSLMEETRILEGKPLPVDLKPTPLRQVLEMGVRYQKPKFATRRRIEIAEGDLQIRADEMKLITVFMNLVGNALKYSDGDVHIFWQCHAENALITIADQGKQGKGITAAQASQLFMAFSRLESHASIEGTGLGLLSVRKIVEAHGGEVFIEGYADGSPSSAVFTTAQGRYPSVLREDLRTAFVVVSPLAALA